MSVRLPEWALPSKGKGLKPALSLPPSRASNGAAGGTEEAALCLLTCSVKRRMMTPMAARREDERRRDWKERETEREGSNRRFSFEEVE